MTQIVRSSGIYLAYHQDDAILDRAVEKSERTRRFIEAFRVAWKRIPIAARKAMRAHWDNDPRPGTRAPRIEITADICLGMSTIAECADFGMTIRFMTHLTLAPDLDLIIARQLADVYRHTRADFRQGIDPVAAQLEIDEILKAWRVS